MWLRQLSKRIWNKRGLNGDHGFTNLDVDSSTHSPVPLPTLAETLIDSLCMSYFSKLFSFHPQKGIQKKDKAE